MAQQANFPMAGGLKYYHPYLRGSVSALTTPKGEIAEQYRYDAFGGLFTGITAPYNTSGLNGHEFDRASGLVDMKARWYAPQNGRFMTADTSGETCRNRRPRTSMYTRATTRSRTGTSRANFPARWAKTALRMLASHTEARAMRQIPFEARQTRRFPA